jgi:hypothetical protein
MENLGRSEVDVARRLGKAQTKTPLPNLDGLFPENLQLRFHEPPVGQKNPSPISLFTQTHALHD